MKNLILSQFQNSPPVRRICRTMHAAMFFLLAVCFLNSAQAGQPATAMQKKPNIWAAPSGQPAWADLDFPKDTAWRWVREDVSDGFQFLHDCAIVAHGKTLWSGWYNCPEKEIVGQSLIRGSHSLDEGKTWAKARNFTPAKKDDPMHYVPVQFLSYKGRLYAFVGRMLAHDQITACMAYVLDEKTGEWEYKSDIAPRFLPNSQPVKMKDGNWIMAGRMSVEIGKLPLTPAVLISNGDDLTGSWNLVTLQKDELPKNNFPETTLWVSGNEILAFTRSSTQQPLLYTSQDYGRHWKPVPNHDLFINTTKPYAGELSTGQHYLIYNAPIPEKNGWKQRGTLAIAVTAPGGVHLEKAWKVRQAAGMPHSYHYPCAIEYNGNLFIVYTASFKDYRLCELAVIPIRSLAIGKPASATACGAACAAEK